MTSHIHQDDQLINQYQVRQPRVVPFAVSCAVILAITLLFFSFPLLISAGLWLLGMALVLISYAFISYHRFAIPVWDTAITGQVIGFLGISLLFLATIL